MANDNQTTPPFRGSNTMFCLLPLLRHCNCNCTSEHPHTSIPSSSILLPYPPVSLFPLCLWFPYPPSLHHYRIYHITGMGVLSHRHAMPISNYSRSSKWSARESPSSPASSGSMGRSIPAPKRALCQGWMFCAWAGRWAERVREGERGLGRGWGPHDYCSA